MTGATPAATPRVRLDTLVLEKTLGRGGQGEVWAVKERKINREWPIAYKQYRGDLRLTADFAALQALVDLVPALDPPVARWLCERSAWPAAVVEDDRGPCGFLMREVPEAFTLPLPVTAGRTALSAFQFLFNSQDYLDRMAIRITDLQRMLLLRDLAGLMERLHELGVAVGDLSANNLLFSLAPQPTCFFIDCDAMTLRGRSVLPQTETAGWQVPDPQDEELGTVQSDSSKYSLLAIRLFLGEQEGTDSGELARVDPALAQLAEKGRSDDPQQRPTMAQWGRELERVIAQNPQGRPVRWAPQTMPHPAAAGPHAGWGAPLRPMPLATGRPGIAPRKKGHAGAWIALAVSVVLLLFGLPDLYGHLAHPHASGYGSSSDNGTETGAGSGTAGTTGSGGSDGSDTSGGGDEQSQAAAIDQLLQRNADTRAAVGTAAASAMKCESLSGSSSVFAQAAASRRDLLDQLAGLAVGDVPGGSDAVEHLRAAWAASADADDAYEEWADGLNGDGCDQGTTTKAPAFRQAQRASARATAAKKAFVAAWNPIADRNSLTTYAWDDV